MKKVLYNIANILGEIATNLASMEAALIQKGVLSEGELDHHTPVEGVFAQNQLALVRQMISALPDEAPKHP
jgi:hypothetical protein